MQNMPALTYGDSYDVRQIKTSAITNEKNSSTRWNSLVVALPLSGWRCPETSDTPALFPNTLA